MRHLPALNMLRVFEEVARHRSFSQAAVGLNVTQGAVSRQIKQLEDYLGVALFITHYAPRRLAQGLGYVVDLLAAVPSVVFGLWGILVLAPAVQPIYVWLNTNASWIPLFSGVVSPTGPKMERVEIESSLKAWRTGTR